MYGFKERDLYYIRKALQKFPEIHHTILFGSRALGNYKRGSDVDLAIVGDRVTDDIIRRLDEWLNERYPLPYQFDLLRYDAISNVKLKQHIDQFGQELIHK